jgi:hypothetical protein
MAIGAIQMPLEPHLDAQSLDSTSRPGTTRAGRLDENQNFLVEVEV